jgi:hypothetical protein
MLLNRRLSIERSHGHPGSVEDRGKVALPRYYTDVNFTLRNKSYNTFTGGQSLEYSVVLWLLRVQKRGILLPR